MSSTVGICPLDAISIIILRCQLALPDFLIPKSEVFLSPKVHH